MKWLCRYCYYGAPIDLFRSNVDGHLRYACHGCRVYGSMFDDDAPIQVAEETYDRYWREFQTDPTFIPPEE